MATITQQYKEQLPADNQAIFGAACIAGIASGGLAVAQAWNGTVFIPWAVAAAAATLIDGYVVGPAFRMIAAGCNLPQNGFELQTLKAISVTWIVYVIALPYVSSLFAVAMSVNVLATLVLSILANTVNRIEIRRNAPEGEDPRVFAYWFVPASPLIWLPRVGLASTR